MAFKRREEPTTIDEERAALRDQHAALEDLKRQLAERVGAVRERELELHRAITDVGTGGGAAQTTGIVLPHPVVASAGVSTAQDVVDVEAARRDSALLAREQSVANREADLDQRERELEGRMAATAAEALDPGAARLAEIDARLAELRAAEKLFLRTRDEIAGRSEAVAARERLVAQRERELDEREDGTGDWKGPGISEMEARLRRLEQKQQPGEQTLGFSGGLRKLEQGTRPQRGS
jgi:hypothetical protein